VQFIPPRCPSPDCPSASSLSFRFTRKGFFHRRCDGRAIQRFLCLHCQRGFSIQTFRLDYRLKKPALHLALFWLFVSKVTMRQSARVLACSRRTIAQRLDLLGAHCHEFLEFSLAQARAKGLKLQGTFQLDELETFEHSRRLAPLTVPVLIERRSLFVLHAESAALPARGGLSNRDRARKQARERLLGKRTSGSRAAVARSFELLRLLHAQASLVHVQTDKKHSYQAALRRLFGTRLLHERISSKDPRDPTNPLFPINHTLAMLRDGVSRLVRRSWAGSKKRVKLDGHLWIWIAYRNYMRGITNKASQITPAMLAGEANSLLPENFFAALWRGALGRTAAAVGSAESAGAGATLGIMRHATSGRGTWWRVPAPGSRRPPPPWRSPPRPGRTGRHGC